MPGWASLIFQQTLRQSSTLRHQPLLPRAACSSALPTSLSQGATGRWQRFVECCFICLLKVLVALQVTIRFQDARIFIAPSPELRSSMQEGIGHA